MMIVFISVIFLYGAKYTYAAPVDSPLLKCVSVDAVGDVTLTWLPSSDPTNSFVEYRIYSSNGGPYTLIGTETTLTNTTFVHNGAGANLGSISYFVTSAYNGSGVQESSAQDTLSSIFLNVNNPLDGTSVLQWNPIHVPSLSTTSNWYHIYMEFPTGTWTLIDSAQVGSEFYRDTITVCDDWLNYRIEISDNSGCTSVSNINGGQFQDMLPPDAPVMNWVSVDTANGNAVVNWNPSDASDASAYIILYHNGAGWIIIDTIYGYNNTSYTHFSALANDQFEQYSIAAFDSCWSGNPPAPNTSPAGIEHRTIYTSTTLDICDRELTVNWTPYENWVGGVDHYHVYMSQDGSSYTLVGTYSAGETSHVVYNVTPGSDYCFVVKANATVGGYSSLSNIACRNIHQPPMPAFAYLQTATVISNDEAEVRFHPDPGGIVTSFTLERADDLAGPYSFVESVAPGSDPIIFSDTDVETNNQSYYYRVSVEDSCGRFSMYSNEGNTILLNVSENSTTLTNLLQWNKYKRWDGTVMEYNIYRAVNNVFDPVPIATVSANQTYYQDNIESFVGTMTEGQFCYYVEAVENINTYGFSEISRSNIACAKQEPVVYAPNAMVIGGVNNTWKPRISLIDFSSFNVKIAGRLGHIVYESSDYDAEWDGIYRGEYVPQGMYIYVITFINAEGNHQTVKGHLTVIR